ncbi:MAG: hypothetical protein JW801_15520 [Bacteroidales bacterium]|nr:hypothetical protein [Bacteroidales bacterium]
MKSEKVERLAALPVFSGYNTSPDDHFVFAWLSEVGYFITSCFAVNDDFTMSGAGDSERGK